MIAQANARFLTNVISQFRLYAILNLFTRLEGNSGTVFQYCVKITKPQTKSAGEPNKN
jgi:hypothetical protein